MKTIRNILLMVSGLVLVLPAALSAAPGLCGWGGGPGWGHPMMFGGGWFMWIINLLIMGIVVFLAVKLLRNGAAGGLNKETPLDILNRRLAKGEITKEELEEIKKSLDDQKIT